MKSGNRKEEKLITESWFSHIREIDDGEMTAIADAARAEAKIAKLRAEIEVFQKEIDERESLIRELEMNMSYDRQE